MSEFIGSRISLISKSDIKYIGTLHEINSETSTVALENVTSFGTEGRKKNPAEEIPGSDQIYEYIVFRGSDVKELTIVEPPKQSDAPAVPNDPAILGSARPQPAQPQQQQQQPPPHQQQFQGPPHQPPYPPYGAFPQGPPQQFQQPPPRFQQGPGQHGFPGAPGSAVPGYGMGPPQHYGHGPPPPGYHPGMGFGGPPPPGGFPPPGHFGSPHQPPPPGPIGTSGQQHHRPGQHPPQPPPVGSGKGTPQPGQHGPPPPAAGQNPVEMAAPTPVLPATSAPPPPMESKPTAAAAAAPPAPAPAQQGPPAAKKTANNRVAVPNVPSPKPKTTAAAAPPTTQAPRSYADATQAATAAVAAAMAKLGPVQGQPAAQPGETTVDNLSQKVNQMRMDGSHVRRGDRGRGRGTPRGGRRESGPRGNVEVPREDYDFESANAKFNKQDLVKEAIASGSPVTSPNANGDSTNPLEATNGHKDEGKADDDVVIPPPEASVAKYDKASSFFDNISSDLKDRTAQDGQTIDGRAIRREERSKNIDTFGQGSVDGGYRGGYRGRGRGRGRGGFTRGQGYYNNTDSGRGGSYRGSRGRSGTGPTATD